MKVGIITFHAALNYGSALQAYALQEYLISLGYQVEIIDFRNKAQRRLYPTPLCFNSIYNAKHSLRRLLTDWSEIASMKEKQSRFTSFLNKSLKLTSKTYYTESQLYKEDWSSFDVIVAGSDQIWNLAAIDSSPAYFIDFASGPLKLSYAPSLGPDPESVLNSCSSSRIAELKKLLSDFNAISVREQGSAAALKHCGLVETLPVVLPDPVLLHDVGFYSSMAAMYNETEVRLKDIRNYVLFYSPGKKNHAAEMLADAAASGMLADAAASILPSEKRMKVLRVSDGAISGAGSVNVPCGPAGFVKLIECASCTVGTSFHLMVFSMLFAKDFWCPDASSDSRKVQLLSAIGLSPDNKFFPFSDPTIRPSIASTLSSLKQKAADFIYNFWRLENNL